MGFDILGDVVLWVAVLSSCWLQSGEMGYLQLLNNFYMLKFAYKPLPMSTTRTSLSAGNAYSRRPLHLREVARVARTAVGGSTRLDTRVRAICNGSHRKICIKLPKEIDPTRNLHRTNGDSLT